MLDPLFVRKAVARLETLEASHPPKELRRLKALLAAVLAGGDPKRRSGHPMQRPVSLYFPGLVAKPWHDDVARDVVERVEAAHPVIEAELRSLLEGQGRSFRHYREGSERFTADGATWAAYYLRLRGEMTEEAETCPKTAELVRSIPRAGDMAMFSALNPGAHIPAHTGPWNTRLTMHLGVLVPDGCRFRVATETRAWEQGKCLLFDDSFEHEAWNDGDTTRFVLLLDIWHPQLTDVEIQFLQWSVKVMADLESRRGEQQVEESTAELDGRWWVGE